MKPGLATTYLTGWNSWWIVLKLANEQWFIIPVQGNAFVRSPPSLKTWRPDTEPDRHRSSTRRKPGPALALPPAMDRTRRATDHSQAPGQRSTACKSYMLWARC